MIIGKLAYISEHTQFYLYQSTREQDTVASGKLMGIFDDLGLSISVEQRGKFIGDNVTSLVTNGTFPSSLTGWTSDTDGGNATIVHNGTVDAVQITTNVGGDAIGHIYQDIDITGLGQYFRLQFESAMSGFYATMQGRFSIYDNDNAAWIIPIRNSWCIKEGIGGAAIEGHTASIFFRVPSDCTEIRLRFYQNIDSDNGATTDVYYDNIELYARVQQEDLRTSSVFEIDAVSAYKHTSISKGGFDTASFSFATSAAVMASWIIDGLGLSIVVRDKGSNIIWEGFVNEVKAKFGSTQLNVGPLLDIANRARIVYKTMDWSTTPPIKGDAVKSVWFDLESSQIKHGVLEGIFSGGESDVEEATQVIQAVVEETGWPDIAHNLAFGGGSINLAIECKGWNHMLGKFFYYRTGEAGKQNLSAKMLAVLEQDPNVNVDLEMSRITENTSQVAIYEDEDKTGLSIIKDLTEMSDANFTRYIWGMYQNRSFVYEQQPTEEYYNRSASDGALTVDGAEVLPWTVRPGRWVKITELIGNHINSAASLRQDPTALFIESVTFTAPYGLSIKGAKISTFKDRLERLGMVG